ncbi:Soluble inorganic pyrophosphatase 1, chloroplastic [Gracilariopsis chorda]|uniref:inorganic diphosphatase n=1 Tax=Gracilariopsis chorda TaxID=448386 RepID=A0A2V3ITF3_9FLOR|nr:Soluble inorganic pyrophosphatase 1, chloroplastic [Gracilariopsis chorda]|eukprot:PXF45408.1 Soluble inorganic pyrophosphatase 1, chloroplastic [Gracilariopsis chorda]
MRISAFTTPATIARRPLSIHGVCSRSPLRVSVPKVPRASRPRVSIRMHHASTSVLPVRTESVGESNTKGYRLFFRSADESQVSPWHDIPLYPDPSDKSVVHFVNEIPRGTQAKMEIATDETSTPIKQDIKKGELRFYKYGPSLINYGAIPQTWEDPSSINPELNVCGDGDPIDVCEIGDSIMPFGAVYKVKVLGCLALLDEGEIDWKILAINTDDPKAAEVSDIDDVEKVFPGKVHEVREWFRLYKTAEGKGENEYAYGGVAKNSAFAQSVVLETHNSWADLKNGKIENEDELSLKPGVYAFAILVPSRKRFLHVRGSYGNKGLGLPQLSRQGWNLVDLALVHLIIIQAVAFELSDGH